MMASLYQSSSAAVSGTSLASFFASVFAGRTEVRPISIDGKSPSARRATSACEASTCSTFLFTVMPLPQEKRPHFAIGKGDVLLPNKKPQVGHWFPGNRLPGLALITSYLLPVFGQFRDHPVTVACKQRAE